MKYKLHYVGSKLYPKEVFIKEAQKLGVNRCLPTKIIKKLKWGDRILLGTYVPKEIQTFIENKTLQTMKEKIDGRKNKRDGTANENAKRQLRS